MKKILTFLVLTFCTMNVMAQDPTPTEKALVCFSGTQTINTSQTGIGYQNTFDFYLYYVYDTETYARNDIYTANDGTQHRVFLVYTDFKDASFSVTSTNSRGLYGFVRYRYGSTYYYYIDSSRGYTKSTVPWVVCNDLITKVYIEQSFKDCKCTTFAHWFRDLNKVTTILNATNLDTSEVTDMQYMFFNCSSLTELDLSEFNTEKVTNLAYTFYNCSSLTELDLSNFNTDVLIGEGLIWTFAGLQKVPELDVRGFNTSDITTLEGTFYNCSALTSLEPLSSWTISDKLTSLQSTFSNCRLISSLEPIKDWNVSNVTTMSNTFYNCSSIETLAPLANWTITNGELNLASTFYNVNKISSLEPIKDWNVGNVTTMQSTFNNCSSIETLAPLANWTITNGELKNLAYTFYNVNKISSLEPIKDWNVSNVTTLQNTFYGNSSLISLEPIKDWNVGNVTTLQSTFESCSSLTNLDGIKSWDISKVTKLINTFKNCTGLKTALLNEWNTALVDDMTGTFCSCSSLNSLDLRNWDTRKVTKFCDIGSSVQYNNFLGSCLSLKWAKFGANFSLNKGYVGVFSDLYHTSRKVIRYLDLYESNDTHAIKSANFNDVFSLGAGLFGHPTSLIYLPHGSQDVTNKYNVVYTDAASGTTLKTPGYYSEDNVEIEIPREFKTNRAEYSRTMASGRKYGTIVLPYDFTSNDDIQCYVLTQEHPKTMYFVEAETVPAHTPFLYEKLSSGTTASFVMVDDTGNFGITVHATRDTSIPFPEEMPDGMTADDYGPYLGSYTITASKNVGAMAEAENLVWETRGYYETTVIDEDENMFYIAQDKFWQAKDMTSTDGKLTVYPHRATFHGNWNYELDEVSGARFFNISTLNADDEKTVTSLIEAGWERQIENDDITVYDMQGRQQQHFVKGMNIVRKSDGSTRKVVKK